MLMMKSMSSNLFRRKGLWEKSKKCLKELKKSTAFLKVLGSYPRGEELP